MAATKEPAIDIGIDAASGPSSGAWPPGARGGVTGWGLLREMSRDVLGALGGWQQAHGDVVRLRIWPEHEVLLFDPDLVRELLVARHGHLVRWERGIQVFRGMQGDNVLTTEGDRWTRKRRALQPALAPRQVQAFVPTVAHAAALALEQWPSHHPDWPIDSQLTALAMDVILRLLFSTPLGAEALAAEHAVYTALHAANAEMFWPASWPDWMPWKRRKRHALATLDDLVRRHIQQRLATDANRWPEDLLTQLLRLHRADPRDWPLRCVQDECLGAFFAGHETVAATLTWWAWGMAAHPEAQAAARAEVDQVLQGQTPTQEHVRALPCLAHTLQETLRLYPAAPLLFTRRSTESLQLGRWRFPARTMFVVPVLHLHRDPRWFPEPQAFRPQRFAEGAPTAPRGAYMPFGAGPRVCVGQHLAMSEMTVIAAMLLQRFALRVPAGAQPPKPVLQISLRPGQPLRLAIDRAPAGG